MDGQGIAQIPTHVFRAILYDDTFDVFGSELATSGLYVLTSRDYHNGLSVIFSDDTPTKTELKLHRNIRRPRGVDRIAVQYFTERGYNITPDPNDPTRHGFVVGMVRPVDDEIMAHEIGAAIALHSEPAIRWKEFYPEKPERN